MPGDAATSDGSRKRLPAGSEYPNHLVWGERNGRADYDLKHLANI
ncbi:hypothetical protein SBA4_5930004 [Candidatus Sulfopaludibacter sp. SbA4]|nr:hypothetical protein SBA4_5930004 [Candidatus Sulfopaludibacter sp. SbA4]